MSWLAGLIGGGLSALGSIGSSGLSSALGQYNAQKSAKYQYDLYLKGLRQAPSAQVEGLRKANLNPLLATGLGGNVPNVGVSAPSPNVENFGTSALQGALTAHAIGEKKNAVKNADNESEQIALKKDILAAERDIARAEAKASEDESSARQVQANISEVEALATLDAMGTFIDRDVTPSPDSPFFDRRTRRGVYVGKGYDTMVEKIRNAIDWDKKSKSDSNFWWRRGIEALHGINEAGSAYDGWRGSRKTFNNTYHINAR